MRFFFWEENGLEINLECFYTAFIQSKFKILDDLSSLKKNFFFFVKFKDMEVGIFLKQMTRSDLLSLDFFVCCYFGYFGLIYISSLKNIKSTFNKICWVIQKKKNVQLQKVQGRILGKFCLEIGLIINDLSLDSEKLGSSVRLFRNAIVVKTKQITYMYDISL